MFSGRPRRSTASETSSRNSSFRSFLSSRRKTSTFKSQAEKPNQPQLKQGTYPVYRLKWEKLKSFLERKFPGYTFKERRVIGDRYIFEIPESLKSADLTAIAMERDERGPDERTRQAESPEPE